MDNDSKNEAAPPVAQVALVTCYNGQGQLLVGKRRDNDLYTLPGGHLKPGEDPAACALRELFEETGLHALSLSFLKNYTTQTGVVLHCFSAFVTGQPHGNNDPDEEIGEDGWEFIDVEEGLPPKVFNHLHGPANDDNLVTQLFGLKKAEELAKSDVWHSDDWGQSRLSIPSADHPDRQKYDESYLAALRGQYGDVKPVKVGTEQLTATKDVADQSRYKLYRKMLRAGDRLPPLVVQKTASGYRVVDGNHKLHAARAEGGSQLDAVEVPMAKAEFTWKASTAVTCPHGLHVFKVDGSHVRNTPGMDSDFDQGGNGFRYHFIPKDEIWVDAHEPEGEVPFIIQHECGEVERMRAGMSYDKAHDAAKKIEDMERHNFRPGELAKAEDEVHRLLGHPNPHERTIALKLNSATPEHVLSAALDPDPSVYGAAIDNPKFGPAEGLQLMEARVGKDGQYPASQKNVFLARNSRLKPYHYSAYARSARDAGPEQFRGAVDQLTTHPGTPDGLLRSLYLDSDVVHDSRMAILGHPSAPADVLDHALRTGLMVPSAGDLAKKATEHKNMVGGSLDGLVRKAADLGEPHVVSIAEHALRQNTVPDSVYRYLLVQATMKPTSMAPKLLDALMSGPSSTPERVAEVGRAVNRQLAEVVRKAEEDLAKSADPRQWVGAQVVSDQLGFNPSQHPAFRAAKFLSCSPTVSPEQERLALYREDGDVERAALLAYALPATEDNLQALRAIMEMGDYSKSEIQPAQAQEVVAAHPEGEDVAEMVRRAFKDSFVFPVALGGKHSKGSLLAYDNETRTTWLLKSGSGGAGGAAGSVQDPSNPNAREAAWYHIAKQWGIDHWFPRAEELVIDGRLFAALTLLATTFSTLDREEKKEPGTSRRVLLQLMHDGVLHQWATMDYVCGNPDRHGQNVMVDPKGNVKLIDHGSAFAGPAFDPAHDQNSFVPYYLRAWALDDNFAQMSTQDKLKILPRVSEAVARRLSKWIADIQPETLEMICSRYGIDPKSTLDRLARLKAEIVTLPADLAVNQLWSTT